MTQLNLVNATLPQYTATLPVSKIPFKFRPFVVKEEKVLLMALQSKNTHQINDAMRNVISACTNGTLDSRKLCTADTEYAFLQIRSKSVGEEVKPQVTCSNCQAKINTKIRLDEITIGTAEKSAIDPCIPINDTLSVNMRYPTIHDSDPDKDVVETAFEVAKRCIDSVVLNEQVYQVKDIDPKELSDFVDNLLPDQFAKMLEFIQSSPELHFEFKYPCPSCKETVKVELKSVSDFF